MKKINYLDFQYRIQKTQQLLKQQNIDCLLLINGNDGLNNQQNSIFTNWLFQMQSGYELLRTNYLDQMFDESIFIIKQDIVQFFVSQNIFENYKELFLSIDYKQIETYNIEQLSQDRDQFEREKSLFFFKNILESKNVGILLDESQDIQNVKDIEKWPLVKIFAIEQLNQGFFTMSKNVTDIKIQINTLFNDLDQPYLDIVLQQSKIIQKNYQLVKDLIFQSSKDTQQDFDIQKLEEPLKEIFKIGKISNQQMNSQNTQDEPYIKVDKGEKYLNNALHMTIHDVCPYTNIMYYRTYLLTQNNSYSYYPQPIQNNEGYITDYKLEKRKDNNFQDEYRISTYYLKMIQFYFKLLDKLKKGTLNKASVQNFQNLLQQKIKDVNQNINLQIEEPTLQLDFFYIDSFLNQNNLIEYIQTQSNEFNVSQFLNEKFIFTIKLSLLNLKSCQDQDKLLGDIVLGDSFYLYNKNLFNFTQNIPYFDFFSSENTSENNIRNMKELYAQKFLGKRIQKICDNVQLYIPLKESILKFQIQMSFEKIELSWFEKGFKIISEKIGDFLVLFEEFVEEFYYFKEIETCYLIIHLKTPLFFKKFSQNYLILKVDKSALHEFFFKFIQQENQLNINQIDSLDQFFTNNTKIFDTKQNMTDFKKIQQIYIGGGGEPSQFQYEKFRFSNLNIKQDPKVKEFILFMGDIKNKQNIISLLQNTLQSQDRRDVYIYQYNIFQTDSIDFDNYVENFELFIKDKKGLFLIDVPKFVNLKSLLDYYKQNDLHIKSVSSCLNFQILINNNFSGNYVDQYIQNGYINICLIEINKNINEWQNDINKLKSSNDLLKFVVFKENRLLSQDLISTFEESFNLRQNQILRQLKPYKQLQNEYKIIEFNAPIDMQQLNKLQTILQQNNGILVNSKKQKVDNQQAQTEIEKQINEFIQVTDPYLKFKNRKTIKIVSLQGYFTFQQQYDKIYFVRLSQNDIYQELVQDNLKVEEIQVENNIYQKVLYPENIKNQIKIVIEYQGYLNRQNQNFLIELLLNKQKQYISKNIQLTQNQIKQLLYEKAEFGLENGDIFDGFVWRNEFGKVYKTHPKKHDIIQNYIQQQKDLEKYEFEKQQQDIENYVKVYKSFML